MKEEMMFDEKIGKVVKGERKKKKKKIWKEKCSFMFLRFYIDGAWNQKKLSIGV